MNFNCKITKVPSAVCDTSVSGIIKLALVNWSEEYKFTSSVEGSCEIDTIDIGTGENEQHFLEIPIADNSGYANANATAGGNAGQKAIMHQVGGVISRLDCNVQSDWKNYLLGRVIIAVMTKNGQVLLLGVNNGLTATNFDFTTGTVETDAQGITFLYEGLQKDAPEIVKSWSIISDTFPKQSGKG